MTASLYKLAVKPGEDGDFRKAAGAVTEAQLDEAGFVEAHLFFRMSAVFLYLEAPGDLAPFERLATGAAARLREAIAKHTTFDAEHPERHALDLRRASSAPSLVPPGGRLAAAAGVDASGQYEVVMERPSGASGRALDPEGTTALALVATIQRGEEGPFEAGLDALPASAFSAVAPGEHAAFVGDGQLVVVWPRASPEAPARLASREAGPLAELLVRYTDFHARMPDRAFMGDVHAVGTTGVARRGPWEGDM